MNLPKIIFLDLDGTILDDNKHLSQRTKEVLRKLDSQGIPVILTSGRMPQGVLSFKRELGINRPIISFSGGLVLDENENVIFNRGLTYNEAKRVNKFVNDHQVKSAFNFYTSDNWYTNNKNHPMQQLEAKIIGIDPVQADFDQVINEDSQINKVMLTGEEAEIDQLKPYALEAFPDLNVMKTQYFILEFINKGVSKREGIDVVLDYFGINKADSIGFGDSINDKEMLDYVNTPVIMCNSDKEMLKNKNYIVSEYDNNHDGVARFLEELYGLNE